MRSLKSSAECGVRSAEHSQCGMRGAGCGVPVFSYRTPNSPFRIGQIPHSACQRGQASLEMTVALMGTLLLLFGSVKVFVWMTQRLVARQQSYEATRVEAGSVPQVSSARVVQWTEPSERLRIFNK